MPSFKETESRQSKHILTYLIQSIREVFTSLDEIILTLKRIFFFTLQAVQLDKLIT